MFAPRNSSPPLNCLSTNEHVAAYQVKKTKQKTSTSLMKCLRVYRDNYVKWWCNHISSCQIKQPVL